MIFKFIKNLLGDNLAEQDSQTTILWSEEELFEFDDRKDILVRNNGFQCEKLL